MLVDVFRREGVELAAVGMVFDNLHSLVGAALVSGEPVISNDANHDPRSAGTPPGHPTLRTYLGLPIHAAGELVAMVGLANRSSGYSNADVQFLQPLLNTIGQLETARRAELARSHVEAELARTSALLVEKTRALEGTLDNISQGITNVDAEGRIRVYNQRYLELLDLPESLLAQQPLVEEVVRFQTERGDFGPNFQLIEPMARNYVASEYAAHGNQMPLPDTYVRRTPKGRYIEVRTRALEPGGRVRTFTDVTDYLSTLEALRQSEARWRSLTDLSSDWYWEQDDQFRFVRLDGNPYHPEGVPDEMHYGLTRWELPDTFVNEGQWREHREQLEAHQVFHDFEMQRLSKDGKPVWVSISGEPIFDEEGRFTGYRGVARDITERKLAEAEIQRLAFYDELTGLPNRRLLMDRLERAVATTQREGSHGALLFLDLDNFKGINDTMGHEVGDILLQQVAQRLKACVRDADTVARLGGDEFVVMLKDLSTDKTHAAQVALRIGEEMLLTLDQPYLLGEQPYRSTCSLGATLFAAEERNAGELLKQADIAMYQVKAQRGNALCFFDPQMQAAISDRAQLEVDLRAALVHDQFELYYQPQFASHGGLVGAEALLRWRHPQRGLLAPGAFIVAAEESELIVPIGAWVLRTACRQLATWQGDARLGALQLSVNVSARQFRQSDFVQTVTDIVQASGVAPHLLKLELTESLMLDKVDDCIEKMDQLKKTGIRFSLDDFGTGYSSLAYLTRLPLDQLKIDQSFVRNLGVRHSDGLIVQTIVGMARSLELEVMAEGVETEAQRVLLAQYGCTLYQGYLFARPAPVAQLEALVAP